jgi:hypothetical protein
MRQMEKSAGTGQMFSTLSRMGRGTGINMNAWTIGAILRHKS